MSDSDEAPLLSEQQTIQQQDQALDDLAAIIRRQRDIGISIGNEVDDQNGLYFVFISLMHVQSSLIQSRT